MTIIILNHRVSFPRYTLRVRKDAGELERAVLIESTIRAP
jgi:hypothetical protein